MDISANKLQAAPGLSAFDSSLSKPESAEIQAEQRIAAFEQLADSSKSPDELKEAFQDFVGQTFFAEMIKAVRSTQQPAAYFHGGRAEEIFQGQLDQVMAEELSDSSAEKIADPMYELFKLGRRN